MEKIISKSCCIQLSSQKKMSNITNKGGLNMREVLYTIPARCFVDVGFIYRSCVINDLLY